MGVVGDALEALDDAGQQVRIGGFLIHLIHYLP